MLACMDNVILLRPLQTRLPRRLIKDGWWLEQRRPAAIRPPAGGSLARPTHDRGSFSLKAIIQAPECRSWTFRAWRLQRYLANNPEATQDGKKG